MRWHILISVIVLLFFVCEAHCSRDRRETGHCAVGSSCLVLSSCPSLQRLLYLRPTRATLRRFRRLTCGVENDRIKVCCPVTTPVGERTTPAPRSFVRTTPSPRSIVRTTTANSSTPPPSGEDLLPSTCGVSFQTDKIIGGTETKVGEYPFMAVLGHRDRARQNPIHWGCGGSLINNRYVLTAAHCTVPAMTRYLHLDTIRLGEHDLKSEKDCYTTSVGDEVCAPPTQDFRPEQVLRHPQFNVDSNLKNDVALIRLDRPAEFNNFVQPVCLPSLGANLRSFVAQRRVTIAGWGQTEHGIRSQVLLKVRVPVVEEETCSDTYKTKISLDSQVCLSGEEGKDSCFMDSGGPAFLANNRNRYEQVALVSFGPMACGSRGIPAVYSNLFFFRNWIVNNLRN